MVLPNDYLFGHLCMVRLSKMALAAYGMGHYSVDNGPIHPADNGLYVFPPLPTVLYPTDGHWCVFTVYRSENTRYLLDTFSIPTESADGRLFL